MRTLHVLFVVGACLGLCADAFGLFTTGLVDVHFVVNPTGWAASGTAATGSNGDAWNNIAGSASGTASNLTLVDGVTNSGLNLSFNSENGAFVFSSLLTSLPNIQLANSYLFTTSVGNAEPSTANDAVISGLDASGNTKYNLFLYEGSNFGPSRPTAYRVIGATIPGDLTAFNDVFSSTVWAAGQNYVEFAGLTPDGTGKLTVEWYKGQGSANNEADFAGFQIQAVPEPGIAFISLAAVLLLRRRYHTGNTSGICPECGTPVPQHANSPTPDDKSSRPS